MSSRGYRQSSPMGEKYNTSKQLAWSSPHVVPSVEKYNTSGGVKQSKQPVRPKPLPKPRTNKTTPSHLVASAPEDIKPPVPVSVSYNTPLSMRLRGEGVYTTRLRQWGVMPGL